LKTGLTYQRKNWLLLPGFLLAIFFCYQYGFKRTLELRSKINDLKAQQANSVGIESREMALKTELGDLNKMLSLSQSKRDEVQRNFLQLTQEIADSLHIRISEVKPLHTKERDKLVIVNSCIVLEGNYSGILKALQSLENQSDEARVVSCDFRSQKDLKSGIKKLYSTIYAQSILYK
jgi:hypothetical protein